MLFPTKPLNIVDHPADHNHCCSHPRRHKRWIVIHATGGTDSLAWLSTTSPTNKPVSSNRLITKKGINYKIVPDDQIAYTQGPALVGPLPGGGFTLNDDALSIELEKLNDGHDPYPDEQLDMCADQVVEWMGAYAIFAIVAHSWVDENKSDPAGFPWDDFWLRVWDRLVAIAKAT